jgi:RimJ/RimL family protein N-acetyltransferase
MTTETVNEFWGKGIATAALSRFLDVVTERPLFGRAAADNTASLRVLEKCVFVVTGRGKGFANARGAEVDELILMLGASPRRRASSARGR